METRTCEDCGQVCEVKISSGYKKPENKGKKYYSCLKCDTFHWVSDSVSTGQQPQPPEKPQEVSGLDPDKEFGNETYEQIEKREEKEKWEFKEIRSKAIELSKDFRKEDMSPDQVMTTTHFYDWLYSVCGDMSVWPKWSSSFKDRVGAIKNFIERDTPKKNFLATEDEEEVSVDEIPEDLEG